MINYIENNPRRVYILPAASIVSNGNLSDTRKVKSKGFWYANAIIIYAKKPVAGFCSYINKQLLKCRFSRK
jgi:hypothetical protein